MISEVWNCFRTWKTYAYPLAASAPDRSLSVRESFPPRDSAPQRPEYYWAIGNLRPQNHSPLLHRDPSPWTQSWRYLVCTVPVLSFRTRSTRRTQDLKFSAARDYWEREKNVMNIKVCCWSFLYHIPYGEANWHYMRVKFIWKRRNLLRYFFELFSFRQCIITKYTL